MSCNQHNGVMMQSEKTIFPTTTPIVVRDDNSQIDAIKEPKNETETKYFLASDTCKKILNKEDRLLCNKMVKDNNLDEDAATREFSYLSNRIDLNDDGLKDAIIWINDVCGTSGCPFYFYKKTKSGFQRVFEEFAWTLIILLNESKNGWKNIAYQITGGGGEPHFVIVQFSKSSYKFLKRQNEQPKGNIVLDKNWNQCFFGPIPNQ